LIAVVASVIQRLHIRAAKKVNLLDGTIAFAGSVLLVFAFGGSSLPLVRFTAWLDQRRFNSFEAQPLARHDCPSPAPDLADPGTLAIVKTGTGYNAAPRVYGPSALSNREALSMLPFRRAERTGPGRLSLLGPFIKGPTSSKGG